MDFQLTEEQQALVDLTEQILADKVDHATLRELEASGGRIHREAWKALADAGVLGALLPESAGGAGVGMAGVSAVLEVVGKHAAPVPIYPSIAIAGQALATLGTEAQQALLPDMAAGDVIVTAALAEVGGVSATDHVLSGSTGFVPSGLDAQHALVATQAGTYLVDLSTEGVEVSEMQTTTGYSEAKLSFDSVQLSEDDLLGGQAANGEHHASMQRRADVAICALTTGICEGALDLLGTYANERQQFNRVIASFQAVSQRAGDSYIDTEAVRLTARSAAFHLDQHEQDPATAGKIAIARWWAAEAGHRVVHAATHIHGGVGVDRDYPLHRHFLMSRQLELTLGNAEQQLEKLGDVLAV